ncbi:MAG: thiamine phosphate synthase [Nitrospirae bacterium]|nr:thiamine phosphate synthase [Nitrospirota bacterium]
MSNKPIDFRLYLITDRKLFTVHCSLFTAIKEALKGGARAIQLREKDLGTRELLKLAYKMRELTKRYNAKLFINDRLDIALAVGADGVHLAQNSIPVDAVRNAVNKKLLIGVSAHSLKEALEAEKKGADFITLGPVYRTQSKLKYGAPLGIETLGAYGVALISEVFRAKDVKGKTKELINVLQKRR